MTDALSPLSVAARVQAVPAPGPGPALANDVTGTAPQDHGGPRSATDAERDRVLSCTEALWRWVPYRDGGMVPVPREGWLSCGFCGHDQAVVRCWQFHTRPGTPTLPRRCDVHVKCCRCAAGWWHGVAISELDWNSRPAAVGIRSHLLGRFREPMLWSSDRTTPRTPRG